MTLIRIISRPTQVRISPVKYVETGAGATVHNDLTERDAADQHPIGAITGLQDLLDDKLESPIAISDVTNLSTELAAKANLLITFGREITEATTILTTDLFKLTYINSATDINITVANMTVGSWIPFDTLGAGLPEFRIGGVNIFPDEDFTGSTSFILIRLPNDGVTERYGVKYG